MNQSFSQNNIITFLLYAFIGAWTPWVIAYFAITSDLCDNCSSFVLVLLILGTLAPFFATYKIFQINKGIAGCSSYRRFLLGKPPIYLGYAIFIILIVWRPFMFAVSTGSSSHLALFTTSILPLIPSLFLGGGFEEFGWRGYLHPALQHHLPDISVPAVVGVIWAFWHLPLWFIPGTIQSSLSFIHFILMSVALSYSFGLLKDTWDSPIPCVIQHAWFNACFYLQLSGLGTRALLLFAFETLLVIFMMQTTVKRGRLNKANPQ